MNGIYKLLIFSLIFSNFGTIFAQKDTVLIDFGAPATLSQEPWNNMSNYLVTDHITPLKNSQDLTTPMGIMITDRFGGVNESGTTAADAVLNISANASKDSFFGNVVEFGSGTEPTGGVKISGLNPAKEYKFLIYASRLGTTDNRETKYKFEGNRIDSVYLNAANNVSNTVSISLMPNADGLIDLEVSPGENNTNSPYKFYYLGVLKIIYDEEDALPAEITINSPNGDEYWMEGSSQSISWSSSNLKDDIELSYSTDNGSNWTAIETVLKSQQSLSWTIPNTVSNECLVKAISGSASDLSDAAFTIADPAGSALRLSSPNGGENWIVETMHSIRWEAYSLSENIQIKYSIDDGANWTFIASVSSDLASYHWMVPNSPSTECLISISSGEYSGTSRNVFNIVEAQCTNTIVVLGSSTAYGTGPASIDSSWVSRYAAYLASLNPAYNVVNLALGGYTSYQVLPTGTSLHPGVNESIDASRNITKALSYSPYAVIINMPSNDANKYYSVENQIDNYNTIINYAAAEGIKVWIATSQPRNFSDPVQVQIQMDLKDTIPQIYGEYSIDFWNGTAKPDGHILSEYNTDGVHMNSDGHKILFERVKEKRIDTLACLPTYTEKFIAEDQCITVYPNPFSDMTSIQFETISEAKIEIRFFDNIGRQVGYIEESVFGAGSNSLSISNAQIKSKSNVILGVISIEEIEGSRQSIFKLVRMNLE